MAMIQSHYDPYKSLLLHVEEVEKAALAIETRHSPVIRGILHKHLAYAVRFHDLGKAIPAFQAYIKAPKKYRGDPFLKAHTPVSLLLWLCFARDHDIHEETLLLVASVVWRHHGDFPNLQDFIYNTLRYEYEDHYQIQRYPLKQVNHDLGLELSLDKADFDLDVEELIPEYFMESYALEQAARLKLTAQLLFSVFLESDRTFLALTEEFRNKKEIDETIQPAIVDYFIEKKTSSQKNENPLNRYRTQLRQNIIQASTKTPNIESVTLPTGLGKTLIAAQWALTHRQNSPTPRKVVIVLPFLSIIDQTVKEYKNLFSGRNTEKLILEAHSIAGRKYRVKDEEDLSNDYNNAVDFYAETWRYEFIITTFDQFLYSLLSSSKKHLIRFHNLTDALIIIDEIQALPPELWHPLNLSLGMLTEHFNTKALIMSATQPGFIATNELVKNPESIFARQDRYQLILKHRTPISLDNFIEECIDRIDNEGWHEKRVLIVLNTRRSARTLIDALEDVINCKTYFLSADVTPKERLDNIERIKENTPCLVVATQCIEAGVDIDMDLVIRDLAPLDSIVQCAGRCNRNGLKDRADVEIVTLASPNGRNFSDLVYDGILLENTKTVLSKATNEIPEEKIFAMVTDYFKGIRTSTNTGLSHAEDWAYWREDMNVKKLLRGDNEKIDFIVESQDDPPDGSESLRVELEKAIETKDPWARGRKLRKLKSRIARISVSIWATAKIELSDISKKIGCYNLLKDEFYKPGRGLDHNAMADEICSLIL